MALTKAQYGRHGVYNATPPSLNDGQSGDLQLDPNGNVKMVEEAVAVYSDDAFQATITGANVTSATAVKTKTAGKSIYVTDLIISTAVETYVWLQDDAGSPVVLMQPLFMPADSVFSKSFRVPLKVAINQDLDVVAGDAGTVTVTVTGYVI